MKLVKCENCGKECASNVITEWRGKKLCPSCNQKLNKGNLVKVSLEQANNKTKEADTDTSKETKEEIVQDIYERQVYDKLLELSPEPVKLPYLLRQIKAELKDQAQYNWSYQTIYYTLEYIIDMKYDTFFDKETCNIKWLLEKYYANAQRYIRDIERSRSIPKEQLERALNIPSKTISIDSIDLKESLERERERYKDKVYGKELHYDDQLITTLLEEEVPDYYQDNTPAPLNDNTGYKSYQRLIEALKEEYTDNGGNI